ncbi:hypothetical protein P4E94_05685 [Pontiellaceae bacterium B12219]|nr:hypothetical protein [Pontiellaceae bacterium B12219]
MKTKKVLKILLGAVAALLLFLVLTFLFWLGPTAKLIAQTVGSKALGTPLQVNKLTIDPKRGIIHLSDFSIKNPEIFGQSNAVSIASLDLAIDMSSLFTSTVVVHQVEINSPYFIYEQSLSSDNISEFILNLQQFARIDTSAPPKPKKEKKPKDDKKAPKVVIIETLAINDVQLNLANTHNDQLDIGVGFEQLSVSMTNGTTRLKNVYVKNPKRLQTPNLFTLDALDIQMVPGSIYSTNIYVKSIEIKNPRAFIEHNPETDTIGELLEIISSIMPKVSTNTSPKSVETVVANTPTEPSPSDTAQTPAPTVTLEKFIISGVELHSLNTANPLQDLYLGLDRFTMMLEQGSFSLQNLHLSNPAGFSMPDALSLASASVQIAPGSHLKEPLIVQDIQISKPHAFLELTAKSNTVKAFLKTANGYISRIPTYKIPKTTAAPEKPASQPSGAKQPGPPLFELHNLMVDDIQIQLLDLSGTNTAAAQPRKIAGIDEIKLNLFEGRMAVDNIHIPNTPGFTATNIAHIALIDVDIEPGTLHSNQFVVNQILIDSPNVNLEQTEESGNVALLQTELMQFIPTPAELPQFPESAPLTSEPDITAESKPPVPIADQPFVLHQLLVTNLMVNLKMPVATNQTTGGMLNVEKLNPLSLPENEEQDSSDLKEVMTLVAFSQLSLEPLKGLLAIHDLRISNPPKFSRNNLIQVEEFRIDLDPDTLKSNPLHIEDIMISKPKIRYERQLSNDNIKALQTEIEQAVMRREDQLHESTNTVAAAESVPGKSAPPKQKVIIDRVLIPGGKVQAKLSALPAIPVPLPTIQLTNLGKDDGGTSFTEAGQKIFNSLYDTIIGSVGNATGFAGDALKGFGSLTFDTLGTMTDSITGATKDATETVEEKVENVKEKSRKRRAGSKRRIF